MNRLPATLATLALGLSAIGTSALASSAAASDDPRPDRGSSPAGDRVADPVQRALDELVEKDDFPGAVATVRGTDGRIRTYTAGVRDLATGEPMLRDGRVRIASNTKMFTATVALQLVGEGLVDLDEPIETYLPGLIRGHGNDGRDITVRMLLQQRSGLPDYDSIVSDGGSSLAEIAHTYFEPRELIDAALDHRREFEPGTEWAYSNTNYIALGLMIQKVTGRPVGEEITDRIIKPLDLRDTYWPRVGEQGIRGRHARGYFAAKPGDPWQDLTRLDPSLGWSAGQLVSTPRDLGRFMQALVGGRLLAPAQLAEMRGHTVPAPDLDADPGWRYGLGIASHELTCGTLGWGHGGDIQGFETRNLVTDDGRWAVVAVTGLPTSLGMVRDVSNAVDTAVCAAG